MKTPLIITRDSGANVKALRKLERAGLIECHDVMLENGRENRKIPNKMKPIGVWGHSRWGESVWPSEDCLYDEIRQIIGKRNVGDAMHLEAHIRSGNDVFVTEDNDFLSKRDELNAEFGCEIMTPDELTDMLREMGSA